MLKYIEVTGKNEEEAIKNALAKLGMDRDDVSVEILERAKSGFLGIGGTPAKIKVTYEAPDEPAPAAEPVVEKTPTAEPVREEALEQQSEEQPPVCEKEPCVLTDVTVAPAVDEDMKAAVENFLSGLMEHMHVEASVRIQVSPEGTYEVELVGQDLGALIGRRGETLDAIQQLTNYSVNRGRAKRVRIHVDAENYRAKREESLIRLANKVAAKVVKYRRNVTLEPMNAYERHVIHTALQDVPGVTTYSVGTEPNRRTVVAWDRD